jgi:hypothetical protein
MKRRPSRGFLDLIAERNLGGETVTLENSDARLWMTPGEGADGTVFPEAKSTQRRTFPGPPSDELNRCWPL